jgi:mxaL protein
MLRRRLDFRLLLLLAAMGALLCAVANPRAPMTRPAFDALVVVDITGSMNVRDYVLGGRPASRLDYVKATLRQALAQLPCPSRIALAVFAERRPFLLLEPIDACANYAPLVATIEALDWRMAWEGDSRIAAGIFRAIDLARDLNVDLLFFTDGQEAPPLPAAGGPKFEGQVGATRGLIVGVGGYALSPIPKFDEAGRETGFYSVDDVPHDNRFGPPPQGAEGREGFDARNAPFGGRIAIGDEHLSSVKEAYLRSLAETTGLGYAHLVDPAGLLAAYASAGTKRSRRGEASLRPAFAFLGGALLFATYALPPLVDALAKRRSAATPQAQKRRRK